MADIRTAAIKRMFLSIEKTGMTAYKQYNRTWLICRRRRSPVITRPVLQMAIHTNIIEGIVERANAVQILGLGGFEGRRAEVDHDLRIFDPVLLIARAAGHH